MQSKEYSNWGGKKKKKERKMREVHILFLYIRKLLLPPKILSSLKIQKKY